MAEKKTVVTLKTNRGDIKLSFFPEIAPEHVTNFIEHSKSGLYKGCLFHRVIPGFMIQGGDPNTKEGTDGIPGTGGFSYKGEGTGVPAEFSKHPHKRGILSMARSQDPDSAGSQFFIMHADSPFLDEQYSVFGEAIYGLDTVDAIVASDRDGNDMPDEDQRILDVIIEEMTDDEIETCRAATYEKDGE